MLEIKILMRELRSYPNNYFAYPQEEKPDETRTTGSLVVCDVNGITKGVIETGNDKKILVR